MRRDYLDSLVRYIEEYERRTRKRVESVLQVYYILASAQRKRKINFVVDYRVSELVYQLLLQRRKALVKRLVHA